MTIEQGQLGAILERAECLLLDFDGPVCSVYAGVPAAAVAHNLDRFVGRQPDVSDAVISGSQDPLEVFRHAATQAPELAEVVHAQLTSMEVGVISKARPTLGARDVMKVCHDARKPIVIVSNNSPEAISRYLAQHDLTHYIAHVEARTEPDPALMKPHPYLVQRAIALAGLDPSQCPFVCDSVTDITAAIAADAPAIGYANKPHKLDSLAAAGAHAVIRRMTALAMEMTARFLPAKR